MFYLFKQYENWSCSQHICLMQQTEILKNLMKVKGYSQTVMDYTTDLIYRGQQQRWWNLKAKKEKAQ